MNNQEYIRMYVTILELEKNGAWYLASILRKILRDTMIHIGDTNETSN